MELRRRAVGSAAALILVTLCVHSASAQTALINGTNAAGTLVVGTTNSYTLIANTGDNIVLRLGSTGFSGNLNLFSPTAVLVKAAGGNSTDWPLAYTATNSGTFTVQVSSFYAGQSGTYVLHLAEFPEAFVVPAGDEGGPMTNGGNYSGTLSLGDLDIWSFTANAGDNIVLRLGSSGFSGNLNLYGPNGAFLKTAGGNSTDWELDYTATNSGTFTVLVSSYYQGNTGTYVLHLAQFPVAFIVPGGDEGGPMTNGGNHSGTLSLGDLDMWSVTANAGDNIVLRLGSVGFAGNLRLYGPNGALLKTSGGNSGDWELAYTATNSGTFTALVSSYYQGYTGTYVLYLAQFPEAFIVPGSDEGGPMTNGGNHSGTLSLGDLEMWSVTANTGDNIVLRLGSVGFAGNLRLYGPDGALLRTSGGNSGDWELAYTATNSGTFTALVSSYYQGNTGTYVLHLAQFPEAFIVPGGDEGGPMTNGGNHSGTLSLGDLDIWSFSANLGDNIVLRLGSVGFAGNLRLYGPNGALLKTSGGNSGDWELAYTTTNSGTFTALVSSYYQEYTGTYVLYLAQFPEAFIVPGGDQGGAMTGAGRYTGTLSLGDLDVWAFTACIGDPINLQLNSTNFAGNLGLYGPTGALLKTAGGNATTWNLAYTATNCGTFAVLVRSYYAANAGTYGLTANGLSDELRLCAPVISGARLTVNGVGGSPGTNCILFSTTNLAKPFGLWTPVLTNPFDQYGVLTYTNGYSPALPQQYFRFRVP
jgi:trimeric autotransporter adhesin